MPCGATAGRARRRGDRRDRAQPRQCRSLRSFVLSTDQVTRFGFKRSDDFDVSDCTLLSQDKFFCSSGVSPVRGIALRIRRIPLADIKADGVVDSRSISRPTSPIRFEAASRASASCAIRPRNDRHACVDDRSFWIVQRDLLLQLRWYRGHCRAPEKPMPGT